MRRFVIRLPGGMGCPRARVPDAIDSGYGPAARSGRYVSRSVSSGTGPELPHGRRPADGVRVSARRTPRRCGRVARANALPAATRSPGLPRCIPRDFAHLAKRFTCTVRFPRSLTRGLTRRVSVGCFAWTGTDPRHTQPNERGHHGKPTQSAESQPRAPRSPGARSAR